MVVRHKKDDPLGGGACRAPQPEDHIRKRAKVVTATSLSLENEAARL